MAHNVPNIDNLKRTWVSLSVSQNSNTTNVCTATNHHCVTRFKFQVIQHFACRQVQAERAIHIHIGIKILDGATIMGDYIWSCLFSSQYFLHATQLVCRLFLFDLVQNKPALCVAQHAAIFLGLLSGHNINET